jgi:hypothetical protein
LFRPSPSVLTIFPFNSNALKLCQQIYSASPLAGKGLGVDNRGTSYGKKLFARDIPEVQKKTQGSPVYHATWMN